MESDYPWLRRPPFCVEKNCEMAHNANAISQRKIDDGYSGMCCGKIIDPSKVAFKYSKALHQNYVHLCIYTQFKGWIRFRANQDNLYKRNICIEKLQVIMGWKPASKETA